MHFQMIVIYFYIQSPVSQVITHASKDISLYLNDGTDL